MTFNLVTEPWLPCLMADNSVRDMGLEDTLAFAPDIRELADPSPLVTFALHRLLLAILHRNFGPEDESQWKALWESGCWNREVVTAYFEHTRPRFDLFDSQNPFYQVASLDFQYQVPVTKLVHELASANNATLFDHSIDGHVVGISAAVAARWLVAHQGFAVGGLVSLEKGQDPKLFKSADAAPLAKGAFILLKGRNLFETLMLNLHRYSPSDSEPFEAINDRPAWEREEQTQASDRYPDGYLDLLTWQSRRIRLHPEINEGALVTRQVVIMKGHQFPSGFSRHGHETMLAFNRSLKAKSNQDPWPAVLLREERAMWRDSLSLIESVRPNQSSQEEGDRPKILGWISDLTGCGALSRNSIVPLDVMGLSTDRAKVLFWRHERLPLPLEYLDNKAPLHRLKDALEVCEAAGKDLGMSIWELSRYLLAPNCDQGGAASANPDEVKSLARSFAAERRFWPKLEAPFKTLLLDLVGDVSADSDGDTVYGSEEIPRWRQTVRLVARNAFEETARGLDTTARSLKAAALARADFYRQLGRSIPLATKEVLNEQGQSA